jgi:hypothetical protein
MTQEDGTARQQAILKLVNILYDTPDEKLSELTEIPRKAVLPLSVQIMREAALDPKRIAAGIPLSYVWRTAYFKLMRSVGRKHFMIGSTLASEQAAAETEAEENWEA